ncbi:PepSY-associated TM helix domain-containing protein [Shewanella aegiceratis]|uniref:PepSY-associated TM helix domain-containing protein n=1 Tax=Shewanella aegiceratis TaxID=2864203 RepID=UPI001C6558EB|nr:PepSY-associated TM helix domain-containing protein [Shewanella aegiceratis]QYJ83556.1 PepSY domain-containing protein [Shewanella aegiceratis]
MRRLLWKWHGWLGLFAALPLFIIALTGSVLVFKSELEHLLMPEKVLAASETRLSFTQLLRSADEALPQHEILGWQFAANAGEADKLYVAKQGTYDWQLLFVDPSQGSLLSQPVGLSHYLLDWLLELHYTLLADHLGLAVTALVSILLILLSLSGFILHRQFWRTFFTLRWGKSLRLFLSDSHKMLGIIGAPLFLILGFTGAWWNIEHIVEEWHEPDPKTLIITQSYYNKQLDMDALLTHATQVIPGFQTHYVRFPDKSYAGIHLFGAAQDRGALRSDYGSIVSFDDKSGQLSASVDATKAGALYQFVDSFRPLHYGNFGGLVSKIIWCVVGFLPSLMALSGYLMWQARRKPQIRRHAKRPIDTPTKRDVKEGLVKA